MRIILVEVVIGVNVLIATCLLSSFCAGCDNDKGSGPKQADMNEDSVRAIVDMLGAMPDWTGFSVGANNAEQRSLIESTMRRIAAYDLDTIRAAIVAFSLKRSKTPGRLSVADSGKLFLLNKYVFALPEGVRRDSPHFKFFGGGWLGTPISGDPYKPAPTDMLSIRWPWVANEDGVWRLTGQFLGFNGPPYGPLEAFDFYRKEFGRRSIGN